MRINNVQPYQPNFGTRVKIDPQTARIISLSKAKNRVLKEITQLENNGINDTLSLSVSYKNQFYINASVFRNDKDLGVSFTKSEPLVTKQKNGKNKYVSITQLYKNAKNDLNAVVINKKSFEKFLPYLV